MPRIRTCDSHSCDLLLKTCCHSFVAFHWLWSGLILLTVFAFGAKSERKDDFKSPLGLKIVIWGGKFSHTWDMNIPMAV